MVSKDSISGYFLEGSEGEFLMVIKSHNEELMLSIIKKISSMRDDEVKKLAEVLENHFYERDNYRGYPVETGPKNKTESTVSNRNRNRKTNNPKS
jgi:hypothetical protein